MRLVGEPYVIQQIQKGSFISKRPLAAGGLFHCRTTTCTAKINHRRYHRTTEEIHRIKQQMYNPPGNNQVQPGYGQPGYGQPAGYVPIQPGAYGQPAADPPPPYSGASTTTGMQPSTTYTYGYGAAPELDNSHDDDGGGIMSSDFGEKSVRAGT